MKEEWGCNSSELQEYGRFQPCESTSRVTHKLAVFTYYFFGIPKFASLPLPQPDSKSQQSECITKSKRHSHHSDRERRL